MGLVMGFAVNTRHEFDCFLFPSYSRMLEFRRLKIFGIARCGLVQQVAGEGWISTSLLGFDHLL
jgi:hypothetical protein